MITRIVSPCVSAVKALYKAVCSMLASVRNAFNSVSSWMTAKPGSLQERVTVISAPSEAQAQAQASPARAEAVQVQAEAVQEEAVQVQEEAVQVQEEAVQAEAVQIQAEAPVQVQEEAVQVQEEAPVQVQEEAVQAEAVQEEAVQAEAVQAEAVQAQAVQIQAEAPVQAAPAKDQLPRPAPSSTASKARNVWSCTVIAVGTAIGYEVKIGQVWLTNQNGLTWIIQPQRSLALSISTQTALKTQQDVTTSVGIVPSPTDTGKQIVIQGDLTLAKGVLTASAVKMITVVPSKFSAEKVISFLKSTTLVGLFGQVETLQPLRAARSLVLDTALARQ